MPAPCIFVNSEFRDENEKGTSWFSLRVAAGGRGRRRESLKWFRGLGGRGLRCFRGFEGSRRVGSLDPGS